MNEAWPNVRLGEVLRRVARPVEVFANQIYREIGIRSHGKGLFHKEAVSGLALGTKRVFWLEPGDFVLNIVFAWEGAVGLIGPSEAGMIGSHRFPTFRADEAQLDLRFLIAYFRTSPGLDLLGRVSPGGAGRNRTLSQSAFLDQRIPLPPLAEQQRVVARIEALAVQIEQAHCLRKDAAKRADALLQSRLLELSRNLDSSGRLASHMLSKPRNGWSAKCDNADAGIYVLSLGAVTGFQYRPSAVKRTSLDASPEGHFWLKAGDLLITRSNTPDLVGHAAIYDGTPSPCIYPDLMMRLDLNNDTVDRRFVWYWLRSPFVRDFIGRKARGTSPTMKKINQQTLMDIPFPSLLSLKRQHLIVAELDELQTEIEALKSLQTETATELDALLPTILNRAFKGEL